MTLTYGSTEFKAATKGAIISSHPIGEHGTAELTNIATHETPAEFDSFEKLTGKLVKVPKSEADAARDS
jgi:hypothetical protein